MFKLVSFLVCLYPVVVSACRPIDLPIRSARFLNLIRYHENESTAVEFIAQASIVNDSMLIVRSAAPQMIVIVNTLSPDDQRVIRVESDILEFVEKQLPEELPEHIARVLGPLRKLDYESFKETYLRSSDGNLKSNGYYGDLRGFDLIHKDTLLLSSRVKYAYWGVNAAGEQSTHFFYYPVLIKCDLSNISRSAIVPVTSDGNANYQSKDGSISYRSGHLWMSSQDLYSTDLRRTLGLNVPWGSLTAKLSVGGQLTGTMSRDPDSLAYANEYFKSQQFLCDGIDSLSMVRVMSQKPLVDLVNIDDGTFRRIPLPESIVRLRDTSSFYVSEPIRFGSDKLALRYSIRTGEAWRSFVVVGTLHANRRDIKWNYATDLGKGDRLMCLVDSNDSPLYRKDLLGIFENVERGPYLARIVVD